MSDLEKIIELIETERSIKEDNISMVNDIYLYAKMLQSKQKLGFDDVLIDFIITYEIVGGVVGNYLYCLLKAKDKEHAIRLFTDKHHILDYKWLVIREHKFEDLVFNKRKIQQ